MKVAVTGAFSYSGKYITRRLLERGEEIVTLTNHPNRPDPFNGKVKAFPLNFSNPAELVESLRGADVLVNTYWIRFDKGSNTQPKAVENTKILVDAAVKAGVKRMIHISITNPSADSRLPYFWGKAANEKFVTESGMSYAILRPTVLFGKEDILVNNIAWLMRRLPLFGLPGDGSCKLSPVYVDDLAELAAEAVYKKENYVWDAVGPDEFTFKEMTQLIGATIGKKRLLIPLPPRLALLAAQFLSLFVNDVMLTSEEVDGLMANLLVSKEPPRCKTSLKDWLKENRETVGRNYASELARHF
ncbi:MAG: epimerase [Chloroflexi bacterium]|nr:NAD-dependent epimerase/dehydratase family protein [Chloroflexi bacterium CFX1]MCK6568268.1 NAD(P)H-binding protein [Anaerolineales bacterium]MCQ3953068.1 epimerase [Chloroflexota bacterium]MDL1919115.1 NAD-dependent epimerase/dehydratase family protein [Chloroflexi bacterium CFX5]NUQ59541.1 NAD(P)H-binding protein [Anaerolineales bacterium]